MNKKQIIIEEIINSVLHGIGFLMAIAGLVTYFFLPIERTGLKTAGFLVFMVSLLLLYLMSTLYHGLIFTKAKRVFLTLDYAMIFILIAGTYTPFLLFVMTGWIRIILLVIMWLLAILGIVLKSVFFYKLEKVIVGIYLTLGWMVIFFIKPVWETVELPSFILLIIGGLCYSIGTVFFASKRIPFGHMIWHIFVLAGTFSHYFAILLL